MSVDNPPVAADTAAADRLSDEYDVEVQHADTGYLFTLDGDGYSVLAYADIDVDEGSLHAGIAATCHHALGELLYEQGGDE